MLAAHTTSAPSIVCSTNEVRLALTALAATLGLWAVFVTVLFVRRPDKAMLVMAVRLLPDTFRLVGRLARDRTVPRSARVPLWLLLAYLALPVDLVPDFVPVIGYADDAILISLVLRRLIRRTGYDKLIEHWPGTVEGLDVLRSVLRLGTACSN